MRFSAALEGMKEYGKRLVFISADNAYGEAGYMGHDFQVPPNTDLLIEVSLLHVRMVQSPEERCFEYPGGE